MWSILWMAAKEKPKYSNKWRWFNWRMLQLNVFCLVLKWIQTRTSYNGLSQHLPLGWGIGTVSLMLIVVFMLYIPTRGIVCGYPRKSKTCNDMGRVVRKYHAYYIAFAITNDLWYHPFETSPGHLTGILNDFLILWQSCVIYHHSHRDKFWTIALELMVLPHSALIAIRRGTASAAGFSFGFYILLMVTQMHGLNLNFLKKSALVAIFAVSVGCVYGFRLECQHADPLSGAWNGSLHYPARQAYVAQLVDDPSTIDPKCNSFTKGGGSFTATFWRIPSGFYILIGFFTLLWWMCAGRIQRCGERKRTFLSVVVCLLCVCLGFGPYMVLFGFRVE